MENFTIAIDLSPGIESSLKARADAKGISLADYLSEILAREANVPVAAALPPGATGQALMDVSAPIRGILTDEEIDTLFARNRS